MSHKKTKKLKPEHPTRFSSRKQPSLTSKLNPLTGNLEFEDPTKVLGSIHCESNVITDDDCDALLPKNLEADLGEHFETNLRIASNEHSSDEVTLEDNSFDSCDSEVAALAMVAEADHNLQAAATGMDISTSDPKEPSGSTPADAAAAASNASSDKALASALLAVPAEPTDVAGLIRANKALSADLETLRKLVLDSALTPDHKLLRQVAQEEAKAPSLRPPSPTPVYERSLSPTHRSYKLKEVTSEPKVDEEVLRAEGIQSQHLTTIVKNLVSSNDATQNCLQDVYGILQKHDYDIIGNTRQISVTQEELRENEFLVYGTHSLFRFGKKYYAQQVLRAIEYLKLPGHLHQFATNNQLTVYWGAREHTAYNPKTEHYDSVRSDEKQKETPIVGSFLCKELNRYMWGEEAAKSFLIAKNLGYLTREFCIRKRPSDAMEKCQEYVRRVVDALDEIFETEDFDKISEYAPLTGYGCARPGGPNLMAVYLFKSDTEAKHASIIEYDMLSIDSRTKIAKPVTRAGHSVIKPINVTGTIHEMKPTLIDPESMGVYNVDYRPSDDDLDPEPDIYPFKKLPSFEQWQMDDISFNVPPFNDAQKQFKIVPPEANIYGIYPKDHRQKKMNQMRRGQFSNARGRGGQQQSRRGGYNPSPYTQNFPQYRGGARVQVQTGRAGFNNQNFYQEKRFTDRGRDSTSNRGYGSNRGYSDAAQRGQNGSRGVNPPRGHGQQSQHNSSQEGSQRGPTNTITQYLPVTNLTNRTPVNNSGAQRQLPESGGYRATATSVSQDFRFTRNPAPPPAPPEEYYPPTHNRFQF